MTPSFGLLWGKSEEIVYHNAQENTYLSQLIWEMKPLWYMGSSFSVFPSEPMDGIGFFADLSLKFGFSNGTGDMEDRDWLGTTHSELTHLSVHTNYTEGAVLADFTGGVGFPIVSRVVYKMFVKASYMHFKWTAREGYLQYASYTQGDYEPWDESLSKVPVYGAAIAYEQDWFLAGTGIGLYVPFLRIFSLEAEAAVSTLVRCAALDDHFGRNLEFYDETRGGLAFDIGARFSVSLPRFIDLGFSVSYRRISGTRGDSKERSTDTGLYTGTSSAGTGYSVLDAAVTATIRF
ncbi:omptin family outer membrane protease [Breznakiella homolactica]|uniref:Omptin family outer membrane protease n=1 Tax=Breznakiella homolactica TaxID=2798577 RepID=A0A7T7XKH0_9SPIR|nr:omptin family outer membrane protease [Breznakiella homolactica]QQO08064.1 omptin family outer membrane protease [Breznakiella homolactica]